MRCVYHFSHLVLFVFIFECTFFRAHRRCAAVHKLRKHPHTFQKHYSQGTSWHFLSILKLPRIIINTTIVRRLNNKFILINSTNNKQNIASSFLFSYLTQKRCDGSATLDGPSKQQWILGPRNDMRSTRSNLDDSQTDTETQLKTNRQNRYHKY